MQQNTQVTPSMVELGMAMVTAVQAILDNPKAAAIAEQERAKAAGLTAEKKQEADEALEMIKRADELRKELQEKLDDVTERENKLKIGKEALDGSWTEYNRQTDTFNTVQKMHSDKAKQLELRETKLEEAEDLLGYDKKAVAAKEDAVKKRELAVAAREQAANEFASKIGGKAA